MGFVNTLKPRIDEAPGKSIIQRLKIFPRQEEFNSLLTIRQQWNSGPQVSDFIWKYSPLEDYYHSLTPHLAKYSVEWTLQRLLKCNDHEIPLLIECLAESLIKCPENTSLINFMLLVYQRARKFSFKSELRDHWEVIQRHYHTHKPDVLISFPLELKDTDFIKFEPGHWHIYDEKKSPPFEVNLDQLIYLLPESSSLAQQFSLDLVGCIEFKKTPYWVFHLDCHLTTGHCQKYLWLITKTAEDKYHQLKPCLRKPEANSIFSMEILSLISHHYYWKTEP